MTPDLEQDIIKFLQDAFDIFDNAAEAVEDSSPFAKESTKMAIRADRLLTKLGVRD